MTLDLAVKIGVKVVASGHHPVFRVICRQGCVQCFIDVVTVITSHLELLEEPITPHGKPAALIDGKWESLPVQSSESDSPASSCIRPRSRTFLSGTGHILRL